MEKIERCKLCDSAVLFTLKRYRVDEHHDSSWQDIMTRLELPTPLTIRLVVCRKCGFMFYQDILTFREMAQLYTDEARYAKPKTHQLKAGRLWELERMTKFLAEWLPKDKIKIALDIGSGDFVALERVVQLHPHGRFEAVDPSYPKPSHQGIKVFRTMVESWRPTHQYDFVMLIHVLEHIGHLTIFMKKVSQLIKNRGYLYVEVPFQVGPGLLLNRSANVQHVNYFTPQSVMNLLANHKLQVIKLEFDTAAYSKNGMPGMIRLLARKQPAGEPRYAGGLLTTLLYLFNPLYLVRSKLVGSLT